MEIELVKIKDTEPKRDLGNIEKLKNSIKEVGLINPLTVNQNYKLLAGRRRYQAVKELGRENVSVRIINSKNELFDFKIAIEENLRRKPLTDIEVATAIREYDEMKRKMEGERKSGGRGGVHQTLAHGEGWTTEKTAKDLGIGLKSTRLAIQIAKAVEEIPELVKEKKGTRILREYKRKQIKKEDIPLPEGKFNVVLADPPWQYDFSIDDKDNVEEHYPTMKLEDIKKMKIPVNDDAVLFLWATAPKLLEALEVMKAWGFTYKTNAIWDKEWIGLGYWFRGQHELLLVGVKGNFSPPEGNKRVSSVYREKRTKHSKKPEYYYKLIENEFPNGKYLELFARSKRKNWESYGDEVK